MQGTVVRAATPPTKIRPYAPHRPLCDWLAYNGYVVIEKETRSNLNLGGVKKKLPRIELEMAIRAMDASSQIDHMVIFSRSGDLRRWSRPYNGVAYM